VDQALALLELDEEIGLDFENFYELMMVILKVKQYGKTRYGTLLYSEYQTLVSTDPLWTFVFSYMNRSRVMDGNY
jgi:hypothetical protein